MLLSMGVANTELTNEDKKNVISVGKKLTTLDDIRLGDYTITADIQITSTAHEELRTLLSLVLKLEKQPHDTSAPLEKLVEISKTSLPSLSKKTISPQIIWNAENQLALDDFIEENYEKLKSIAGSKETEALLTYIHAQHLFTKKQTKEGMNVLRSIVKDFSGTAYEVRAEGEIAFRLFLNKNYDESLLQAKIVIEKYSNTRESQDALYFKARSYYQLKQYKESIADFDEFIKKYPTNKWRESAKYFKAKTNYYLRNLSEAANDFEDFVKEFPQSAYKDDARELSATCYANLMQLDKAIEAFEKYKLENKSAFEQIAAERRIASFALSQSKKSLSQKDTTNYRYYDSIFSAFPAKMERLQKQFLNDNGVTAEIHFSLADYYANYNNIPKAISILEMLFSTPKYLTDNPNNNSNCEGCTRGLLFKPWVERTLMLAYTRNGDFSKTTEYKNRLLKQHNLNRHAELEIAELETMYQKKIKKEANFFETKLTAIGENKAIDDNLRAKAFCILADILMQEKNKQKAIQLYAKLTKEFETTIYARVAETVLKYYEREK